MPAEGRFSSSARRSARVHVRSPEYCLVYGATLAQTAKTTMPQDCVVCAPLTALGANFRAVTAFRLSCSVPTLLRGTTAFQAASPAGVAPPTATTSAIHHRLGLILRVLAPFGWRASAVSCSSSARPHSAQRSRSVRAGGDARSA